MIFFGTLSESGIKNGGNNLRLQSYPSYPPPCGGKVKILRVSAVLLHIKTLFTWQQFSSDYIIEILEL